MTEISPAAQAVFDAVRVVPILLNDHMERVGIAAALRAAVVELRENLYDPVEGKVPVVRVEYLHAIADELEAQ